MVFDPYMWHADGRLGVVDDAVDLSELLDLDVPGEATEFVEVFSTSSSGVTLMVGWLVQEEGEEVAIFLLEKKNLFFKKWVISLLSTYSFSLFTSPCCVIRYMNDEDPIRSERDNNKGIKRFMYVAPNTIS